MDKIIELYKLGIDKTLIIENLKKSPIERIRAAEEMLAFACKLKIAKSKKSKRSQSWRLLDL